MQNLIKGIVTSIFSDDINTDDIIPAWTLQESTDRSFFKQHAFSNYDSGFVKRCSKQENNIVVAGKNFGCGSSREQAVYALSENNVVAVISTSYPDIFYRNSLNNGLVLILVDDITSLKLNENITIDLEKNVIISNGKKYPIKNPQSDLKTFALGGKIGKVRQHLALLLDQITPRRCERYWYDKLYINRKSQTMVEKIVSDHLGKALYKGETVDLPIDVLFFNEVIGPPAIKDFKSHFSDVKVFDPKRVFFIPDHTVPSSSVAVSEGIDSMEQFSKEQGVKCYKEGDGIEHVVLMEDGYIVPGQAVLGTDSHTDTNGALNTLAFGIGTTDGTYALATGYLYDFIIPETIRINVKGSFNKGVYGKDLILYLIGKLGVDGASKNIVEFGGPGLKNISLEQRITIANMGVEMGARTAIFEPDEILKTYLVDRSQFQYKFYLPDKNAAYVKTIDVNLSQLEPCVAFPHKPGNVTYISQIDKYMKKSQRSKNIDFAPVKSLQITDAFLGACTNGRYEDFIEAAKILKNRKIHPKVNFVAIPASRKVYNRLMKEGILQIFAESGANIESSNCGPCFGKHMGIVGRGAQTISSSNRNYIGRMGSKDAKIFLASPVTVAAAAITGKIVDPRQYL
ncbi:MAG: 3-isopropylmalate dehydratase large subunit [Candidatus Roizmanbacteria bacterium GW2011_GWA2_36_23]|uniref:3-isopropylmalate dehydratase large subunit n=1 Tax=Candidatus Roizmanbacteria bacterium GW2011_GWA2_36_23 TaxID=1618480 RepID=A0A0G0EK89_9BACT|nr:MAG: 3-isopropylmalate dehydratase large subunit [Candidatus Roizmanbacteria bacterium GW2011_GWA2_36_23]